MTEVPVRGDFLSFIIPFLSFSASVGVFLGVSPKVIILVLAQIADTAVSPDPFVGVLLPAGSAGIVPSKTEAS